MEAILACHPALSIKGREWVAKWCERWRPNTDPIVDHDIVPPHRIWLYRCAVSFFILFCTLLRNVTLTIVNNLWVKNMIMSLQNCACSPSTALPSCSSLNLDGWMVLRGERTLEDRLKERSGWRVKRQRFSINDRFETKLHQNTLVYLDFWSSAV